MSGETILTVVGNLTAEPELRFTPSGLAVATFTVASTPHTFDKVLTGAENDDEGFAFVDDERRTVGRHGDGVVGVLTDRCVGRGETPKSGQSPCPFRSSRRVAPGNFTPRPPQNRAVAVGTALSGGPPHRSQRAGLPHWAPTSGVGVEAHAGPGMRDADGW